jgi:hypothetical protein
VELQKHNKEFSERVYFLDDAADSQLSMELIQLHEGKCTKCQEDRLSCTVRPACKDRNFLNMLIELGVEPQDLPSFCYSQHLEQIRRFILEKKGRGMVDRRLPIKDLLATLRISSIRQFTTRFGKIWAESADVRSNNLMLVAGDNLRFHFDFARGIVILNPIHYVIKSFEVIELYISLLSQIHELKASVENLAYNWWIITIYVDGITVAKAKKQLQDKIHDSFEALYIGEKEDGIEIQVEIVQDGKKMPVEIGDLEQLFRLVSRLTKSDTADA